MLSAAGAFLATAAGKAVAGTAIAAASVGGLAATDVIELPSQSAELPTVVDTVDPETGGPEGNRSDEDRTDGLDNAPDDLPEGAQAGQSFAANMQDWADCVATNAAAQGDEDPTEGEFDPTTDPIDCGNRPTPPTGEGEGEGTGLAGADNAQNADDRQPDVADVSGDRGAEARESAPAPTDAPAPQADAGAGNAPVDAGARD